MLFLRTYSYKTEKRTHFYAVAAGRPRLILEHKSLSFDRRLFVCLTCDLRLSSSMHPEGITLDAAEEGDDE
jgi:hypothetical protein